jgi:Nif-specific regulatory protein
MGIERIDNRYDILERLGKETTTAVYKVQDLYVGRVAVLKLLLAADATRREDFEREFLLMQDIRHPFFPEVFDFGMDGDRRPYFTMSYAPGVGIRECLGLEGAMARLPHILYAFCLALRCLHDRGLVHCDLKPENLKVDDETILRTLPRVKVLDLGLSRPFFHGEDREVSGTVDYLAPEVIRGDAVDQRADIYSLGITLYEALTGSAPYSGRTVEVIHQIVTGEIAPIGRVRRDLPSYLCDLIDSMVSVRPSDRPLHVEEIMECLEENGGVNGLEWGEAILLPYNDESREAALEGLLPGEGDQREGQLSICMIEGEVGSGKTTLIGRLRGRLQVKGVSTIHVDGLSSDGPFSVFDVVARAIDHTHDSGGGESTVQRRANVVEVEAIISRLVKEAAGRRITFLIDHVEEIDLQSLIALKLLLIGLSESSPRCCLALDGAGKGQDGDSAVGGDGLSTFLMGLEATVASMQRVEMPGLSRDGVSEALRGMLGEVHGGLEELAAHVHLWTGGNISQLRGSVLSLYEGGILRFSGGKWKMDARRLREVELSALRPYRQIAGWGDLGEFEKDLLCRAAVLGDEFEREHLVALADGERGGIEKILSRVLNRGRYIEYVGGGRIRFKGGIIQRYFYDRLGVDVRRRLHRKALSMLMEGEGDVDPLTMAWHFEGMGERRKGLPYLRKAVERYRADGNMPGAFDCLKKIRDWGPGGEGEAFGVAMELGGVLFEMRSFSEAAEEYRKADKIARGREELVERRLKVQLQLARSMIKLNALDEAEEILLGVGKRIGWKSDNILTGRVQREIGWIHFQRGRLKDALRFYKVSLSASRGTGDRANLNHLCNDIAVLYQGLNDWKKAELWAKRALSGGYEAGDRVVVANAMSIMGLGLKKRGYYSKAEARYRCALEAYRDLMDDFGLSQVYNNMGELYREWGDLEKAVAFQRKSLFLKEFQRSYIGVAYNLCNLGLAHRAMGKFKEARGYFRRSFEMELGAGDRDGAGKDYGYLAEIAIVVGDLKGAEGMLKEQKEIIETSESPYLRAFNAYLEGLIDLKAGHDDRAEERLLVAMRSFGKCGYREEEARAIKELARCDLKRGRAAAALEKGRRALKTARAMRHRELAVQSLLVVAESLDASGRPEEATEAYREALRVLGGASFKPIRADALLAFAEHLFKSGGWKRRGRGSKEFKESLSEAAELFREMGISDGLSRARSLERRATRGLSEIGGRELFTLYEAGRILNSCLDIEAVLAGLMDLVIQTMDVERGVVFIKDKVTGELVPEIARNVEQETIEDARSFSGTILNDVQRKGAPIFVPDCREDGVYRSSQSIVRYSILSVICVPLRLRGEIIGTIYVDDRRTTHLFDRGDVDFLLSLGDMAAIAIQNARLFRDIEVANSRLKEENRDLRRQVEIRRDFHGMIGRHRSMKILYRVIEKVAQTDASVLIRGENGSGKELVARAVHYESDRRENAFVVVNCAAIPEALLESEIFGIEKGTATGVDRRIGKFEQADGGTLFLDEIGDMSPAVQAKFLRVLQEKHFQRVGGRENISVDVKILAATNKDLEKEIQRGRFRKDLYYRLNALPVFVPSLMERIEDIPLLVEYFLRRWSEENDRDLPRVDMDVIRAFSNYEWPGNIRQLKNVVERMALMSSGGILKTEDLPPDFMVPTGIEQASPAEMRSLRSMQLEYIKTVFLRCGKNKKKACEVLGITYKTLQSHLSQILE